MAVEGAQGSSGPSEGSGSPNPASTVTTGTVQAGVNSPQGTGTGTESAPAPVTWDSLKGMIPKELAGEKSLEVIKDFPGLVKGYVEGQKYMGGAVRVPKADAPTEEWNKFYNKLGRPESSEGYQLAPPDLTRGAALDPAVLPKVKSLFHSAGLTTSQAQVLLSGWGRIVNEGIEGSHAKQAEALEALQQEWGAAYNNNLTYARSVATQLGGPDVLKAMDRTGAGNDPAVVKFLMKVGKLFAQDGVISTGEEFQSVQTAQEQIDSVLNLGKEERQKHPYWNRSLSGHKEWVEKMYKLQELVSNTGRSEE